MGFGGRGEKRPGLGLAQAVFKRAETSRKKKRETQDTNARDKGRIALALALCRKKKKFSSVPGSLWL